MLLRVQLQFFFSPVQLDLVGGRKVRSLNTGHSFLSPGWTGADTGSPDPPWAPQAGLIGWLLWMLEAPPGPLGSAVLIGWLLWRPLCLFTPELSVGPAARVAAKVQSQHPSRNQRLMINTQFPCPRPPGHGGDACSSLPSSFPSRIHLPVLTGATCSITTPLSRPSLL